METYDLYEELVSENEAENEEEQIDENALIYYSRKHDRNDTLFSLTVFQIVVCVILCAVIFLLSFTGSFREKIGEGFDYFQSFELTKDGIEDEIAAMKEFISDAQA